MKNFFKHAFAPKPIVFSSVGLFLSLISFIATAGVASWEQGKGLYGGSIYSLASGKGRTLYAGTAGGIYRSRDGGQSWKAANRGIASDEAVYAITASTQDTVYAGVGTKVYKSNDAGENWKLISKKLDRIGTVKTICVTLDGQVLIGAYGGAYRSKDGGKNWQAILEGLTYDTVTNISITKNGLIYAATDASLNPITIEKQIVHSDAPISLDSETIPVPETSEKIASDEGPDRSQSGVFLWSEEKKRWKFTGKNGLDDTNIQHMLVLSDKVLYAATPTGIFQTRDGGRTWITRNKGLGNINIRALASDHRGVLFAATADGLYSSQDAAASWKKLDQGIPSYEMSAVLVDRTGAVFAATMGAGIFSRKQGSQQWQFASHGLNAVIVNTMLIAHEKIGGAAHSIQVIYAGTIGGVAKSLDKGKSWKWMNHGLVSYDWISSLLQTKDGTLYLGANSTADGRIGGQVFKSENQGNTWVAVNDPLPKLYITSLQVMPSGRLFVGTNAGVFHSDGPSAKWITLSDASRHGEDVVRVEALHRDSSGDMYAMTSGMVSDSLYRLDANYPVWERRETGLPQSRYKAMFKAESGTLYLQTQSGVFRSTNQAKTWEPVIYGPVYGPEMSEGRALFVSDKKGLYLGVTSYSGISQVSRIDQQNRQFTLPKKGLPRMNITALIVDEQGHVYVGTAGKGIYRWPELSSTSR